MIGKVQAVITEDSDLLPFGVKKCFFKMDRNGNGFEIDLDNLNEVKEYDFKGFKDDMLLTMCILSGCDYLDSVRGVGFKKAYKLVQECGENLDEILQLIRREPKFVIPNNYEQNFEKALLTFKFQLVYCPIQKDLVHLHDPSKHPLGSLLINYPNLDFLGEKLDR